MSKARAFFKKYFWEGQKLSKDHEEALQNLDPNAPWLERVQVAHRKLIGLLIPLVFYQTVWWALAIKHNLLELFLDRYILSLTMIVGGIIGGMTTEGGGAVAFPVMTLALNIQPAVARDFSMMIQSCGLSAATFAIFWMKIKIEWHSILFCSLGSLFGIIFGLEVIDGILSAATKKLSFVSIWFSFAFALYLLNRQHKRPTFDSITDFCIWKAIVLLMGGFLGGIFTSVAGSGVDICSFSILSLLFRVSEKVATPTSVVLMAVNSMVGFFWRELMTDTGAELEAWKYLAVCVPIVTVFAPIGSFLASHFHRQVLAFFIYILDTVALITALFVIPMNVSQGLLVGGLILGGFMFFFVISKFGEKLVHKSDQSDEDFPSIDHPSSIRVID